jgi:hypothetical protein
MGNGYLVVHMVCGVGCKCLDCCHFTISLLGGVMIDNIDLSTLAIINNTSSYITP